MSDLIEHDGLCEMNCESCGCAERKAQAARIKELERQLVERDALIERMRESLIECLDDSHQVLAEYEQLYNATYRPQRLEEQRRIVSEAQAVISLTPPQAQTAHDAEVRRKALEEVVELWDAPYAGETFICRLRRMAAEKREGGE